MSKKTELIENLYEKLGSEITDYLKDDITEISINQDNKIFLKRGYNSYLEETGKVLSDERVNQIIEDVRVFNSELYSKESKYEDRTIYDDDSAPLSFSTVLPNGEKFVGILANKTNKKSTFLIKRRSSEKNNINLSSWNIFGTYGNEDYESREETIKNKIKERINKEKIVRTAIRGRKNILVIGADIPRRLNFLNACLKEIEICEQTVISQVARTVILENNPELLFNLKNVISIVTGNNDIGNHIKILDRIMPDRMIIPEITNAYALNATIEYFERGYRGTIFSLNAKTEKRAFKKMEDCVETLYEYNDDFRGNITDNIDLIVILPEEQSDEIKLLAIKEYNEDSKKFIIEEI